MRSVFNFIIKSNKRYNNSKDIEGKELILNTEISERDYMYTNRIGVVKAIPAIIKTPIKPGDSVILHHNVFRRWIDIRGKEKDSSSRIQENDYMVAPDQIYAYKRNGKWKCLDEYCFVKPIKEDLKWSVLREQKLLGELVYSNEYLESLGLSVGDVVGFSPDSEYEFNIDDEKLYRVLSNQITIKYESAQKSN
mgnify:FL=1|tara:strand:+ start:225 stop:803 length:579 start_codon:yes stop_codon:yes gene_type:complete